MFHIKHYVLPHEGVIPGARGLKKITIPAGTRVYCIVYETKIFWCAYMHEHEALKTKQGLEDTVSGNSRRKIELNTLIAWNFKDTIPKRIFRSKEWRKG